MRSCKTHFASAFIALFVATTPAKADICSIYRSVVKGDFTGARDALVTFGSVFRDGDCWADDEEFECDRTFTSQEVKNRFDTVEHAAIGKDIAESIARPCGLKVAKPKLVENTGSYFPNSYIYVFAIRFSEMEPINVQIERSGDGASVLVYYEPR